jgi:hypothetical protein
MLTQIGALSSSWILPDKEIDLALIMADHTVPGEPDKLGG